MTTPSTGVACYIAKLITSEVENIGRTPDNAYNLQ